ncbi:MAG: hypothetical protein ACI4V1_00455 [Eubacteriales bacterium]
MHPYPAKRERMTGYFLPENDCARPSQAETAGCDRENPYETSGGDPPQEGNVSLHRRAVCRRIDGCIQQSDDMR